MRYIVTGYDGQLGGRVSKNMLKEVSCDQLIFTFPDLTRLSQSKKEKWKQQRVTLRQANYDNINEIINAFKGEDRICFKHHQWAKKSSAV